VYCEIINYLSKQLVTSNYQYFIKNINKMTLVNFRKIIYV